MEWLNGHADLLTGLGGLLFFFTGWNVNQGWKVKELALLATLQAAAFQEQKEELKKVRERQDAIERGWTDELRRLGEKLAHIEGLLRSHQRDDLTSVNRS